VAYQYLNQFPGNGNYIALATAGIITNKIMGVGKTGHDDLTMISRLFSDNIVVLVRADSPLKDARALVARLREDPKSLSLGIATGLGGANHIALASALKAGGVDVKNTLNVVYKSGGAAMVGLLSGDVEVFPVAVSAAVGNLKSGRVRALAIASTKRMSGELASIPTLREQGIQADYAAWRVIVGPRGLDQDQVRYWDAVMGKLSAMPDWKSALDRGYSVAEYLNNRDTREFVEQQFRSHRAILGDLGLEH
jgi:putative tricarboxylic transport membrane protein